MTLKTDWHSRTAAAVARCPRRAAALQQSSLQHAPVPLRQHAVIVGQRAELEPRIRQCMQRADIGELGANGRARPRPQQTAPRPRGRSAVTAADMPRPAQRGEPGLLCVERLAPRLGLGRVLIRGIGDPVLQAGGSHTAAGQDRHDAQRDTPRPSARRWRLRRSPIAGRDLAQCQRHAGAVELLGELAPRGVRPLPALARSLEVVPVGESSQGGAIGSSSLPSRPRAVRSGAGRTRFVAPRCVSAPFPSVWIAEVVRNAPIKSLRTLSNQPLDRALAEREWPCALNARHISSRAVPTMQAGGAASMPMVLPLAIPVEPSRGDQSPSPGAQAAAAEVPLAKLVDQFVALLQRGLAQPGGQSRAAPLGSILEHDDQHGRSCSASGTPACRRARTSASRSAIGASRRGQARSANSSCRTSGLAALDGKRRVLIGPASKSLDSSENAVAQPGDDCRANSSR